MVVVQKRSVVTRYHDPTPALSPNGKPRSRKNLVSRCIETRAVNQVREFCIVFYAFESRFGPSEKRRKFETTLHHCGTAIAAYAVQIGYTFGRRFGQQAVGFVIRGAASVKGLIRRV